MAVLGSAKMHFGWQAQYKSQIHQTWGCFLEYQIFRFAKMILCDSAALRMTWPHFFVARSTLERWDGKIAKRVGTSHQLCTQLSIFAGRSRKRAKERQGDR